MSNETQQQTEAPSQPSPTVNLEAIAKPVIMTAKGHDPTAAEEYRKLKLSITRDSALKGLPYTLLVTSALSGDGKSITALNCALALTSDKECTVILIDADLRKPSLCRYLGISPQVGLAHFLEGETDIAGALLPTSCKNLFLVPAGKRIASPVELINQGGMYHLIHELKRMYPESYIVIDSSPVLPYAEARLISAMCESVIFVVREGGASDNSLAEAFECLAESRILGTVFNKATPASLPGGYHYYYRYYNINYGIETDDRSPRLMQKMLGVFNWFRGRRRP